MVRMFKIKSFTDPNKEYVVRHFDTGEWKCNCPHFITREKRIGECKHIVEAKKQLI